MSDRQFALEAVHFDHVPGWKDDDPSSLFAVMAACRRHIADVKPYRPGAIGLTSDDLLPLLEAACRQDPQGAAQARAFFQAECVAFQMRQKDGQEGFVTAYYEPDVAVSDRQNETYRFPFYRRPEDLVDLDDGNRPAGLDPGYMFGQATAEGVRPYPDRRSIDEGCLEGRGLEIAWAKSKVDVFFAHVQGACRLRYPDGRVGRITYAAKAGHPFSAIGKLLIDRGEISRADISMQSIRAWLSAHPQQVDEILWHNRSYIFFKEAGPADLSEGPIAAAKVPLVAGRSLAVDKSIHSFGFPIFVASQTLRHLDGGRPFRRLMLALDTGSAIVGPQRGDIFTGSGDEAGELAGTVRNPANFFLLVPKAAARRLLS